MSSKTARASAVKEIVVKKVAVSQEEAIRTIRTMRPPNANLFVGNMEYVDRLLEAYDAALVRIVDLEIQLQNAAETPAAEPAA